MRSGLLCGPCLWAVVRHRGRRCPPDLVVPAGECPDDAFGADGVGAVNEDRSDAERPSAEGGFFHEGHHRHDAVVAAEVVVEPEFVDEAVAVLLQEMDTFAAGPGDPGGSGERPEVVNAEDDRRRCGWVLCHLIIIAADRPREPRGVREGGVAGVVGTRQLPL